jgi:hypothetical protein
LYCRVKWLSTDVSEVRTASIIRDDHPHNFTRQYNPEDSSEQVYFQPHIACHVSVGFKHLLYQLPIFGSFVVVQKVISNQSECFPCFSVPYITSSKFL